MKNIKPIALTPGEPAGIGPDLILQLADQCPLNELIVIASPELLEQRAVQLDLSIKLKLIQSYAQNPEVKTGELKVHPVPLRTTVCCGQLDPANGRYVLDTLDQAIKGCRDGIYSAMVTGPVQKSVINEAGILFSGHTEYLADLLKSPLPVMLLANSHARVALLTTHIPLTEVIQYITHERIEKTLHILQKDLMEKFGIKKPRIMVLGLNPHAGESGHLGTEELDVIEPVLNTLRDKGMDLLGPIPADTAFTPRLLEKTDAILSMYHDQGLPPLKTLGFGQTVNITLGLPIIRTSVDHGTALDLTGTGQADSSSLLAAIEAAKSMIAHRDIHQDS